MKFGYFTLFVALVISVVAEFYSIVGLTSIFSAAFWPVVIMGAALGVGKLTAAVWLKLNWERASWTYKLYLVPAVVFLMFLTSMGIFGFLSKAHSDASLVSGDVQAKIAVYDEKIKTARDNIDANRKALKQMDEAVDQVMGRSTDEKGADKAITIRRAQQKERARLLSEIAAEQKTIGQLNAERAPIAAEVRKVEAEVGPIKYIAAMIYGDNTDANLLEAAVRWVIILIVAVFDPLALMLILAAQQSIRWSKEQDQEDEAESEEAVEEFFQRGKLIARGLDADENARLAKEANDLISQIEKPAKEFVVPEPVVEPVVEPVPEKSLLEQHPYLTQGFAHFENLKPMVYQPEVSSVDKVHKELEKLNLEPDVPEPIANHPELQKAIGDALDSGELVLQGATLPQVATVSDTDRPADYLNSLQFGTMTTAVKETAEPMPKNKIIVPEAFDPKAKKVTVDTALTADNSAPVPKEVKAHFGIVFPSSPEKGEVFLRVDYLPSRLFKYNGSKWIEVDKSLTDTYVYNEEYIKFLIAEINAGRVDADELSDSERDQITEFLVKNESNSNPT